VKQLSEPVLSSGKSTPTQPDLVNNNTFSSFPIPQPLPPASPPPWPPLILINIKTVANGPQTRTFEAEFLALERFAVLCMAFADLGGHANVWVNPILLNIQNVNNEHLNHVFHWATQYKDLPKEQTMVELMATRKKSGHNKVEAKASEALPAERAVARERIKIHTWDEG